MALEAAYAFDGSGDTVSDLSGNGRDINLAGTNGIQIAGGQTNNALGKNGPTMPVLPPEVLAACQTDDRTIMFDGSGLDLGTWWVRFNDPTFGSGMWGVLDLADGFIRVQARDNTGSHNLLSRPSATSTSEGVWHNYCATYVRSSGVCSLYRDGVLVESQSFAAGTELSTTAAWIDLAEWGTTGPAIDNLRFYSNALDATEVAAVAGTPVTATGFTTAIGMAVETDTAFPLTRSKTLAIGMAVETDTAMSLSVVKASIRMAVETDTAMALGRSKNLLIGRAAETDTAFAVQVTSGTPHVNVNAAIGPTRLLERATAAGTRLGWVIGSTRSERGA
jgi:hypothetical protein